jgi:hypothetical protein
MYTYILLPHRIIPSAMIQASNVKKVFDIYQMLEQTCEDLVTPGRIFVSQDECEVWETGSKRKEFVCFLFSDIILLVSFFSPHDSHPLLIDCLLLFSLLVICLCTASLSLYLLQVKKPTEGIMGVGKKGYRVAHRFNVFQCKMQSMVKKTELVLYVSSENTTVLLKYNFNVANETQRDKLVNLFEDCKSKITTHNTVMQDSQKKKKTREFKTKLKPQGNILCLIVERV